MPALKSSNLAAYEYDPETRVLTLDFHDGSKYAYDGVPQAVVDGLAGATSPGGFAHRNIFHHFATRRIS